ncbi:unnamed protein product [Heterobilharzia americana]|nr:unnamed protein product [Heterobilharzia americana]
MDVSRQACSSEDVVDCVIVNKTVQHILPEIIASIKDEIKTFNRYLKDLSGDYMVSCNPDRILHKPFLKLSNGEVPPPNTDTVLRTQRKEWNLSDVRSVSAKRWLKKELIFLIEAVATCVRNRQIQILEDKRDLLLSKISKTYKRQSGSERTCKQDSISSMESSHSLLSELQECESKLYQIHLMPKKPPKWLVSAIANMGFKESEESTFQDIFKNNGVHKLRSDSSCRQSAQNWYELLSSADSIISPTNWIEISNIQGKNCINDNNARLTWIHRLQPNINRSKWSKEEDKRLTELVREFGESGRWEEICKALNTNRTVLACFQRWQTVLNPNFIMYRPWSTTEDTALMDILKNLLKVYSPGLMDWDIVSAYHPTRSRSECRSRAPIICPAFHNIVPKVEGVSDRTASVIPRKNNQASSLLNSFSLAEDLQLLMAVQRYGIAGGRVGHGGGIGIGSWALVTNALPGRSASSCRKRYVELCEQFQPWTCYEDQKLYRLVLNYGPYVSMGCWRTGPSLQIFTNLLPYFPGRSTYSLQSRFRTLRRWARLWYELREKIPTTLEDSLSSNSAPTSEQSILLYSPFAAQFVSQLKNSGVPDPETEAYRILTTWKTIQTSVKSTYSWAKSDWKPNQIDEDFIQLLGELASGVLVQQHLNVDHSCDTNITSYQSQLNNTVGLEVNTINHETRLNTVIELSDQDKTFERISFSESKWLVYQTQMKHVLAGSVRKCLSVMAGIPASHSRRESSSTSTFSSVSTRRRNFMLHNSSQIVNRNRENQALLLLHKEHLFWMTFDQIMHNPKVVSSLKQITKISMLRNAAPFIARQMVSRLSHKSTAQTIPKRRKENRTSCFSLPSRGSGRCKRYLRKKLFEKYTISHSQNVNNSLPKNDVNIPSNSVSPSTSVNVTTPSIITVNVNDATAMKTGIAAATTAVTTTTTTTTNTVTVNTTDVINSGNNSGSLTGMTESRRRLLLEIQSILKRYERKPYNSMSTYALSTNIWSRGSRTSQTNVSKQERFIPPILRGLPPEIGFQVFCEPELLSTRCLEIARSCLSNGLGISPDEMKVSKRSSNSTNVTMNQSVSLDANESQRSQPNKEKGRFSQFVELRQLFCALPGQNASDEEIRKRIEDARSSTLFGRPIFNVARTLLSPKYTDFINRSLALLLWPALFANIPAKVFMENAKHHWQEALEYSLANAPEPKDKDVGNAENVQNVTDNNTHIPRKSRQKRRRRDYPIKIPYKRFRKGYNFTAGRLFAGSRVDWAKRTNSSTTFTVTGEDGELVPITLPDQIKILYACGFRPESFLNLKK